MIKPENKLPFIQILSKNRKKYQIIDIDNILIADNVFDLGDAIYIEESCNKYPKAIELLKEIEKSLPSEDYTKEKDLVYFYNNVLKLLKGDINDFLKEIE